MKVRFLPFLMLPILGMSQANSNGEVPLGGNTTSEKQALEIKRNAFYNLEEIKVRWKKAALENCPGVPCVTVTVPGSPTIVNVVAGNAQATVSFTVPSSTGGSAITGYTVTSTPVGGTGTGTGSPITVNGLSNGTSYTFSVIATNAEGSSLASAASTAVTPSPPFTCGASTISDKDLNTYNTVLIGTQCWTKENLKVTKYNDGTAIPIEAAGGSTGISTVWQMLTTGAYAIYANEGSLGANATNYGYLYNWYAVADSRKLCPEGWHVPTDSEWTALETQLLGAYVAGTLMKSNSPLWYVAVIPSPGTNTSGFSGLPGGFRYNTGEFEGTSYNTSFWSATEGTDPSFRTLDASNAYLTSGGARFKSIGFSVRCLRD